MKHIFLLALICLTFFTSCITRIPPKEFQFAKSRTYEKSYDVVWSKLIEWFANNNTPIKNLDKSSGLITTERRLKASDNFCDCGTINRSGAIEDVAKVYADGLTGNINVLVKKQSETVTIVEIRTFYHCTQVLRAYAGGLEAERNEIDCNSNGELEKSIYNYLNQ